MNTSQQLWDAIYTLYEMLVEDVLDEDSYQSFFESNTVVFPALGFDRFASFEKKSGNKLPYDDDKGYRPEPDFVVANSATGEVWVFELKRPERVSLITSRNDGNRLKFKANVESYISQCIEYIDSISGNVSARKTICEALGIPAISVIRGILVYGQDSEDRVAVTKLIGTRTPSIEIWDFDLIIAKLLDRFKLGRPDAVPLPGWAHVLHLEIDEHQYFEESYIVDIGEIARNRFSLFVRNGNLVSRIIDQAGKATEHDLIYPIGRQFSVCVECAASPAAKFIYVSINGVESEFIASSKAMDININSDNFIVGADLAESKFGSFKLQVYYGIASTMRYEDRLGSRHFAKTRNAAIGERVHFQGIHFMRKGGDGSLYADGKRRPKLVKPPKSNSSKNL